MRDLRGLLRPFSSVVVIVLTLILLAQIAVSRVASLDEQRISSPSLEQIPMRIGNWTASGNGAMEPGVEEFLKPDNYILREYEADGAIAPMNLFIAYFKSLQNSYGPHSPKVCLPGSGWMVRSATIANVSMPNWPGAVPVNQYEMERDGKRILVVYWYQNQRKVWAEEFQAKLFLLPDLLRYRQFDVSLIRIITPLEAYSSAQRANLATIQFAQKLFPPLGERLASVKRIN